MQVRILFLLINLLFGVWSRADFTIVQKVEGGANEGLVTLKIKGQQARADLAPQISMITNTATGDVITLQHSAKVFIKISGEQALAVFERVKQQQKATNGEPPKLTPTGRKEKVDKYECEIFTWTVGEIRATDWIAPGFPNFPAVLVALEKFQSTGLAGAAQPLQPPVSAFPGMLLKRELIFGGQKNTTTLVSVTEDSIDDAIFKIPEGYKEQVAPVFNFGTAEPTK